MAEQEPVRAAGIILFRMKESCPEFLLLRNASHGTWGFPKGHCEENEPPPAAARRETMEETGIEIARFCPGFEKTITYSIVKAGSPQGVEKSVTFFLAPSRGGKIVISGEHGEARWAKRLAARNVLQFDILRELLDCAHSRTAEIESFDVDDCSRARTLLDEVSRPDEPWHRHSLEVARVATLLSCEIVAQRPEMPIDPQWVEAAALLHDIGRSRSHGARHPLEGFRLLREKGLDHLSKTCVSHWLKGRSRNELENDPWFSRELLDELFGSLDLDEFTPSEKIVALADSLVMQDKLVTVEERYSDASERYGQSSWMNDNLEISRKLLIETARLLGQPVYGLLGLKDH